MFIDTHTINIAHYILSEKGLSILPLFFSDAGLSWVRLIMEKRNNDFICTFTCRRQFRVYYNESSLRSIIATSADTFALVLIQLNKFEKKIFAEGYFFCWAFISSISVGKFNVKIKLEILCDGMEWEGCGKKKKWQ